MFFLDKMSNLIGEMLEFLKDRNLESDIMSIIYDKLNEKLTPIYGEIFNEAKQINTHINIHGADEFLCRNVSKFFKDLQTDEGKQKIISILVNEPSITEEAYEERSKKLREIFEKNFGNKGISDFIKL